MDLAQSVLKRLGELPVDTAALQACSIGRTMNRLKKAGPEGLREDAAALVAKWKRVVDAESASAAAPGDGGAKRDRCACAPPDCGNHALLLLRVAAWGVSR